MGALSDIATKRNPYLSLEIGESVTVVYKGFKMVPSTFDPTKENFRFLLELDINGEKSVKYWDTGSNQIAKVLDTVSEGQQVKLTKISKGQDKNGKEMINWIVEPVDTKKK